MKILVFIFAIVINLTSYVRSDCYMHTPRGSNNRNNEKSANRANGNRMFDSQNNNRGGYNVGDRTDQAAGNDRSKQFEMTYFMSPLDKKGKSVLPIEWTNQHGCGGNDDDNPHKLNCNLVIQMMCQEDDGDDSTDFGEMRDGINTQTNDFTAVQNNKDETYQEFKNRRAQNEKKDRGVNENYEWYDKCNERERNKGLFTADQNLKGDSAKHTRQNPDGTRRGYECPEERDYHPYWHPSPWKDIIVLAENKSRCDVYQKESFNVRPRHECVHNWKNAQADDPPKHYAEENNEEKCKENGGEWKEFNNFLEILDFDKATCDQKNANDERMKGKLTWALPMGYKKEKCLVKLEEPRCEEAMWSRVNHLGNGVDLEPLHIFWELPSFPSKKSQRCVLRIRYNISTDDYDPINTDSRFNGEDNSPVTQNPRLEIGLPGQTLRLAINTAQFGRTFQDRSHVFKLKSAESFFTEEGQTLHAVQVRGKRGNIVQTFPAVEYDFFPTNLKMEENDLLHFSWTGSNTHNNGNPAGDGQAGDAGQGTGGTDRNNVCGMGDRNTNFILPADHPNNLCEGIRNIVFSGAGPEGVAYPIDTARHPYAKNDACIQMMSSGFYKCFSAEHNANCDGHSLDTKAQTMNNLLNNAPASFPGIVLQLKPGTYNYTCSRNNAYTNRSQKATIIVEESERKDEL